MRLNLKLRVVNHLRQNVGLYLLLSGIFAAGVLFGSLGTGALQPEHQQDLADFIKKAFADLSLGSQLTLVDLLWENLKALLVMYVLGMTIIGMPFIFILVFTRGFVLGFAAGFLIQYQGWQGIFITIWGIGLPSLISVPVLVVTAVCAIAFSLKLVRGTSGWQGRQLSQQFAVYSGTILGMLMIGCISALIQGYLSPLLIKLALGQS